MFSWSSVAQGRLLAPIAVVRDKVVDLDRHAGMT
jgi:hypothetical protein